MIAFLRGLSGCQVIELHELVQQFPQIMLNLFHGWVDKGLQDFFQ